jgi:hypothetical protein
VRIKNTTGTSSAGDYRQITYRIEAQDVATSGWDYTNSTAYMTVSFWVRSSVAGKFYFTLETGAAGNEKYYGFSATLVADTWKKVEHSVPGNSALSFANTNARGLGFIVRAWLGTDYTDSGFTENTWGNFTLSSLTGDDAANWAGTTNSTLDVTGLKMEINSQATEFEFLSFAEDLARCQRYYFKFLEGNTKEIGVAWYFTAAHASFMLRYPTTMRATPTGTDSTGTGYYTIFRNGGSDAINSISFENGSTEQFSAFNNSEASGTAGQAGLIRSSNASAKIEFDAEL